MNYLKQNRKKKKKKEKSRSILERSLVAKPCRQDEEDIDCYFSNLFIRWNALNIRRKGKWTNTYPFIAWQLAGYMCTVFKPRFIIDFFNCHKSKILNFS